MSSKKSSKMADKATLYADKMIAMSKSTEALMKKRNDTEKRLQTTIIKQAQALKSGNQKLASKLRVAATTYDKALLQLNTQLRQANTQILKLGLISDKSS